MERVSCFPNEGTPEVLSGEPQNGDIVRQNGSYFRYYEDVAPTPAPRLLSKTAFMDHAVAQFKSVNSSTDAEALARFVTVMEAARTATDKTVQYCYQRYEAADTFEKTNTSTLTALMAADSTTGHLTSDERTAVLDNWPT